MENGRNKMNILYNDKIDLLYIRLDDKQQDIVNKKISEDIVLVIREEDRIIGIEILDASKNLNLERLFPIRYKIIKKQVELNALQAYLIDVPHLHFLQNQIFLCQG
jgi:uncharacterized protein YuzE